MDAMSLLLNGMAAMPPLANAGHAVVRRILSTHLKGVYRALSSGQPLAAKAAFKLMTAMAAFSAQAAEDLMGSFDLTQKAILVRLLLPDPRRLSRR
jgi:hypothetical protein